MKDDELWIPGACSVHGCVFCLRSAGCLRMRIGNAFVGVGGDVFPGIESSISLLARTRKFVNQPTALSLYNALVLPHIDYCCMVWGAKPALISKIQKLQNRALRIVLKLPPLTPTNLIFSNLNTMTVSKRIHFQLACQAFRASTGAAPDYLCRRLNMIQPGNRPTTRAITQGSYIIPKPNCEIFKNSFSYRAPSLLNTIPLTIRSSSYSQFRSLLKEERI